MGIVELSETVLDSHHNFFGIAILHIVSFADPTLFLTFGLYNHPPHELSLLLTFLGVERDMLWKHEKDGCRLRS